MKKKIKDLTLEEQETFCNKYLDNDCESCPLHVGNNDDNMPICIRDAMNREVEVKYSGNACNNYRKPLTKEEFDLIKRGIEMRLTKEQLKDILTGKSVHIGSAFINQMLNEFYQYKDIEDDFGVDLITLFKALTDGFWVRKPIKYKPKTYRYDFVNPKNDDDVRNEVSLDVCHKCIYDWDNYMAWRCGARHFSYDINKTYKAKKGFAWALTKEELL